MLCLLIFFNGYCKMSDCKNYGENHKEPMAKKNSAKHKNKNPDNCKYDCFCCILFFEEKNINKNINKKQNSVSGKINNHFFRGFETEFPNSERKNHKEHRSISSELLGYGSGIVFFDFSAFAMN